MNNPIKKIKTIVKSHIDALPVEQKWYQDRIAICEGCERNSENAPIESLTAVQRIRIASPISKLNARFCTACECPIDQKCSVRSETCGMSKLGLKPKWRALEVFNQIDSKLSIVNLSHELCDIKTDATSFILEFKPTELATLKFSFILFRSGIFDFTKTEAPCSCTVSDTKILGSNSVEFSIKLSTNGFRIGLNERVLIVGYMRNGVEVKVPVKFLYNKK